MSLLSWGMSRLLIRPYSYDYGGLKAGMLFDIANVGFTKSPQTKLTNKNSEDTHYVCRYVFKN
jgi:hypothetical protein